MLYCKNCKEEVTVFLDGTWKILGYNFDLNKMVVSLVESEKKSVRFECKNCGSLGLSDLISYCELCREFFPISELYSAGRPVCKNCLRLEALLNPKTLYEVLEKGDVL